MVATMAAALVGGAVAAAPAASAVGASTCSYQAYDWGYVKYNGVNFRSGPGAGYTAKGVLYSGDDFTLLRGTGDWLYVELEGRSKSGLADGTRGWVYRSYTSCTLM